MWLYFQEIFADISDQARLWTVLITTTFAFAVVFFTQWLISLRENKKFLTEKSERLYKLCSQVGHSMELIIEEFNSYNEYLRKNDTNPELIKDNLVLNREESRLTERIDDLAESLREILLLESLYFNYALNKNDFARNALAGGIEYMVAQSKSSAKLQKERFIGNGLDWQNTLIMKSTSTDDFIFKGYRYDFKAFCNHIQNQVLVSVKTKNKWSWRKLKSFFKKMMTMWRCDFAVFN